MVLWVNFELCCTGNINFQVLTVHALTYRDYFAQQEVIYNTRKFTSRIWVNKIIYSVY